MLYMYDMTVTDGTFMLEPNYISKVTLQKSQNGLKYEKSIIQDQFFSYILKYICLQPILSIFNLILCTITYPR